MIELISIRREANKILVRVKERSGLVPRRPSVTQYIGKENVWHDELGFALTDADKIEALNEIERNNRNAEK